MTLKEFKATHRLTFAALAELLGKPVRTVIHWCDGSRRPHWNEIPGIMKATSGQVTANDFVPAVEAEA